MAARIDEKVASLFTSQGFASAVAYPILGALESGALGPLKETIGQRSWADCPIILPSINDVIRANMSGFIGDERARRLCMAQGVAYNGNRDPTLQDDAYWWTWRQVAMAGQHRVSQHGIMEAYTKGLITKLGAMKRLTATNSDMWNWLNLEDLWKSVPSVETVMSWLVMGFIDRPTAEKMIIRAGGSPVKWLETLQYRYEYPGISQGMSAFVNNRIPDELRALIVKRNGGHDDTWFQMLDVWREYPGIGESLRAFVRGRISEDDCRRWLGKQGADFDEWQTLLPALEEMPLPQMALQALVRNRVTEEFAQSLVKAGGADWATWSAMLPSMATVPSVSDALELRNRGLIGDDDLIEFLKQNGVTDTNNRELMSRLRYRVPSPIELAQMGTRLAFNGDLGTSLGLFDGQPPLMKEWMDASGAGAQVGFDLGADGVLRPAEFSDLYWAMSRKGLSIEQAVAAYRRLRPDQMADIRRFVPDAEPFDRTQLRGWMTYHGVPAALQPQLEELGYLPLSLREIRTVVRLKTRPKEWVIARLQDQGHRADRASDLYDILADQEKWRQEAPLRAVQNALLNKVVAEVQEQYSVGTVARPEARDYLINARVNPEVVDQLLNVIDAKLAANIAKEGIRAVRKDYLNGTLNADEVASQLQAMGIAEQRVQDYVSLWTIQRNRVRRTATTAQILSWVAQGILDAATAQIRLANLGWDRPDILTQVNVATGKLLQQEARISAARDKQRMAQAKELDRVQKEHERIARQLQADQRRATPRTVLDSWLCGGLISEGFYLDRMGSMGFDPATAREYLEAALAKKACTPAPEGTAFPAPHKEQSPADNGSTGGQLPDTNSP